MSKQAITDTQLLADIHEASAKPFHEKYVGTHPDADSLRKQGITGPKAPYVQTP